jgi:hypothetical protein
MVVPKTEIEQKHFEQDANDITALLKYLQITKAQITGILVLGLKLPCMVAISHPAIVTKTCTSVIVIIIEDGAIAGFFDAHA